MKLRTSLKYLKLRLLYYKILKGGESINLIKYVSDFVNPKKKYGGGTETIIANIKEEIFFKELAMYTAFSYIAAGLVKCEFKTFENGKEVKNKDYFTLNYSPNPNQTAAEFWYKVVEKMYKENEALVIPSNGNLYCADNFTVEEKPFLGDVFTNIQVGIVSLNKSYKADEVFRFKLENTDVKELIDGLYASYGKILAYAMRKYKKSNSNKYKLKISQVKAGDADFIKEFNENIKAQLKSFMENEDAVYPEFDGYELLEMTPKNNTKDSKEITEVRKDIFEMVAQAFKIPQSLMTGNITNLNEVVKTLITFGIDPVANTIENELTRKPGYDHWKAGNYIKVDTSKINHIDVLDVADKVDKLISSGTFCVDEIRDILGHEALGTEFGTTHFITKNYDTAERSLKGDDLNK